VIGVAVTIDEAVGAYFAWELLESDCSGEDSIGFVIVRYYFDWIAVSVCVWECSGMECERVVLWV